MAAKAPRKQPAPKRRTAKPKTTLEASRSRLELDFHTDARGPSAVQFAFLSEIARNSGLTVAEVRRGMNGLSDTLVEGLKNKTYTRIPGLVSFFGARPKQTQTREIEINGRAKSFKARTTFRLQVRGTALSHLRKAFADLA